MSAMHSLDEIELGYTDDDYKPSRPDPKLETWFEWRVDEAKIKRAKNPKHLTLVIKANALDANAAVMFPKWLNLTLPVAIASKDIECPDYAKDMFLNNLRGLFPEHAAYDEVEKDLATKKNVYYKDGKVLKGEAFTIAAQATNRTIGQMAKEFARLWLDSEKDEAELEVFLDRRFFAILKATKDGKYVNLSNISANPPKDKDVVYDRKDAYKPK